MEAYVSCRGYVSIPQRVWETIKQGGTAVKDNPSLAIIMLLIIARDFFDLSEYYCMPVFIMVPAYGQEDFK